ncbi:MAG: hypothetical protein CMJ64_22815 [Planctomycetaceae bacterium]|nr:hypothetical protein [Planctomycetaceae bacterium]
MNCSLSLRIATSQRSQLLQVSVGAKWLLRSTIVPTAGGSTDVEPLHVKNIRMLNQIQSMLQQQ